jgi:hypothetical protein
LEPFPLDAGIALQKAGVAAGSRQVQWREGRGGVCRGSEGARGLGGQGRVATLLFFGSVKQRKFLDARVVKGKSGQAFERGSRRLHWWTAIIEFFGFFRFYLRLFFQFFSHFFLRLDIL